MGIRVLYLVRHGQYVTDEEHRRCGQLTALGRRQARRTGKRLANVEFDAMYYSDLPRAAQTAELIAEELEALPCHSMRALRELIPPLPRLRGMELRTREDVAETRVATHTLTKKFLRAPKGRRLRTELVVAHGNLIRYLVRLALKEPARDWIHFASHHCGITVLTIPGRPSQNYMTSYNDIGHLPPSMQTAM